MSTIIKTRPASPDDREFIISLVPRLAEFGPPTWRNADHMAAVDIEVLSDRLMNQSEDIAFFIAEDSDHNPLGFIHLQAGSDYYNKEKHGHIADIIIAREGEGRGIARVLMEKAEEWARSKGFRWLTLNVFAENHRAREVYKCLGYGEDIMKYVKEIG